MFNHIMIGSNDIERSKRFYDAVLGVLGAREPFRNVAPSGHVRLFYIHDGSTFAISEPINDEEATCANGGTIGFKCVKAAWAPCIWPMCVILTATSSARFIGLSKSPPPTRK